MTTATVVYRSHTGTTKRYAEAITARLRELGIDARCASVGELEPAELSSADLVLLGCWTEGWFVIHQHPDVPWLAFARDVTDLRAPRVGLFTTYKLATGSMFPRMREALAPAGARVTLELASRDGALHDRDRQALDAWVAAG